MIHIIGTSHIASDSIKAVQRAIDELEPDVVAVELDPVRLRALREGGTQRRARSPLLFLMQYIQQKLGETVGITPGSEMLTAADYAEGNGIPVAMIDQHISQTMVKLKQAPLREKIKLVAYLLVGSFIIDSPSMDLDSVPDEAVVDRLLLRFEIAFPYLYETLVSERNKRMAQNLSHLDKQYDTVIAVVGAAHRPGLTDRLEDAAAI
ncbi:MAG: TraB/GumN family protein [Candidatus Nanohaloarchaeota archaeon QJJ-5]|nr:TraB/GumN family protein [Candidatus Nanohaloarchaeota archaeon QJJ-5]